MIRLDRLWYNKNVKRRHRLGDTQRYYSIPVKEELNMATTGTAEMQSLFSWRKTA